MKKPGRTYVIQQDEHLQNLRKIIKRDFFSATKQQKSDTIQLSLNDYISNFKSNQNQIFSQLVQADKQKWKNQHWWLEKQDKLLMIQREKLLALKSQNNQYQNMIKTKDPKMNLIAIQNQQAKNSIFFNKDKTFGSYLSQESEKEKKIHYKNCRINKQQDQEKQDGQIFQKKLNQEEDQNPMTWGQLAATPLRIQGQDQYRIPQRPEKDVLLDKLNKKICRSKIDAQKSIRKSELMMKIMGSSTPSYKKSSYIRNSSLRRVTVPLTPVHPKSQKLSEEEMKGLLNFQK